MRFSAVSYMESIGYTKCIILAWVSIPNMGDEAVA
jgi:hypothetical protein